MKNVGARCALIAHSGPQLQLRRTVRIDRRRWATCREIRNVGHKQINSHALGRSSTSQMSELALALAAQRQEKSDEFSGTGYGAGGSFGSSFHCAIISVKNSQSACSVFLTLVVRSIKSQRICVHVFITKPANSSSSSW